MFFDNPMLFEQAAQELLRHLKHKICHSSLHPNREEKG